MKFSQIKYNSDSLFSNLEISYNLRINQNNHEIFKYFVLQFLNQMLTDCNFQESCHITILQMLPKDWDLAELTNWRPIANLICFTNYFPNL